MRGIANAAAVAASRRVAAAGAVVLEAYTAGAVTKGSAGSPKSTSDTITIDGSKPNRLLLAAFTTSSGGSALPGVGDVQIVSNVGPTALTQVPGSQQPSPSNLGGVQWRYLLNPPGGTHTVNGNYSFGAWINGVAMVLFSLSGVDQAAPFGTPVLSAGNGTQFNNTLNADVGDLLLWAMSHDVVAAGMNRSALVTNLGSADAGYGDYTSIQAAAATGTPLTLTSTSGMVHSVSGLPVLAA